MEMHEDSEKFTIPVAPHDNAPRQRKRNNAPIVLSTQTSHENNLVIY